jgi:REP element-mobilizing transposase RayT
MTTPRSSQIDLSATPYYHCIARCVRRSYLCGYDSERNKDFSHRKQWIVDRIKCLSQIFYIDICAFAIMSNHYHLVLHVNQVDSIQATFDELLGRWQQIFPGDAIRLKKMLDACLVDKDIVHAKITKVLQNRLASISWFMRCLNESIARMANKEDNCSGRFWEGRFKSQALLDEGALLSAMVYVDLNPIRANQAQTPESSDFTSIQERLQHYSKNKLDYTKQAPELMPFVSNANSPKKTCNTIDFLLEDYFTLVDTTGRIIRDDKKGAIPSSLIPILDRLQLTEHGWLNMVNGIETNFSYAIGNVVHLKEFIPGLGNRNSKCIDFVEQCYQELAA